MENAILEALASAGISGGRLLQMLVTLMVSILFIQSGLDKVVNWKGESDFYKSHFKKTFLKNTVPLLMPVITIAELSAGLLSCFGFFIMLFSGNTTIAFLGMLVACLSIIMLFFGQRVAKDYGGAATLVPYFLMTLAGLYLYVLEMV